MENNNYYAPENSLVADNGAAKQYIQTAGSLLAPAIVGLVLTWFVAFVGQIVGLVLSGKVNSKIANLPVVDETMLDAATLEQYRSACGKVKAARIIAKITKILAIVTLAMIPLAIIVGVIYGVVVGMAMVGY